MTSLATTDIPDAQGNDIFVTQEGRLANASMPSASRFEQLIQKYKFVYYEQITIPDKVAVGEKVLEEFISLDPPGRIWLESQETSNVFHEVTSECQAAHICRIFLILEWHPLVFSDSEEEGDEGPVFDEKKLDYPGLVSTEPSNVNGEIEERPPPRRGIPPVLGSILVDFFTTFRNQSRAFHQR